MKSRKPKKIVDPSTEEKIKNAAKIIFHRKGFAATRTRDIALEADINLALLNYYFRSKEKLFDIIMMESFQEFLHSVKGIFNDENTDFETKIEKIVSNYIDLFINQPDIPIFLLNELRHNPEDIVSKINIKEILLKSSFLKQFNKAVKTGKIVRMSPLHFIMNLMGMTVFPFVASPVLKSLGDLSQKEFNTLMIQRKKLIPEWTKMILMIK